SKSESNSSRFWRYSTFSIECDTRSSKLRCTLAKISWELTENSTAKTAQTTNVIRPVWNSTIRVFKERRFMGFHPSAHSHGPEQYGCIFYRTRHPVSCADSGCTHRSHWS